MPRSSVSRGIAYDPFHADPLVQFIQADRRWNQSIEFIEVSQSTGNMSPAMKELEALVLEDRIHHDGDPGPRVDDVQRDRVPRPHDCIVPDKERPELKIDGAVALMMAIAQASLLKQPVGRTSVMVI